MYRITKSGIIILCGLIPLQIAAQSFERVNSSGVSSVLFLGVVILMILLIITFIAVLHTQRKALKERLAKQQVERQRKEVEFQKMIADTALSSLRAQMNPHFIFNCLNSIKLYTSENNSQAASDYLSKFARLMRLVLENSRADFVPLSIELETLELYIELEAMRFKDKLQYRILLDPGLDTDLLKVPPLLIQPYVENAIWHGLMQKEEGGLVSIQFIADDPDSSLLIIVEDNGIGRERAAQLKTKTAVSVKSFGMAITSDRIALLNQLYSTRIHAEIEDLYQKENREAAGTKVTLKIPVYEPH